MRHRLAGVHLSRTSAHRQALFSNLVSALITHEHIQTTVAKAKETRRIAERTITWARRLGDVLTKKPERRTPEETARYVHAMRTARRVVKDREALQKLFEDIGPRYLGRAGGYTRIVKLGPRPGDAAPMSILELLPAESEAAARPVAPDKGGAKSKASGEAAKGKPAAGLSAKGGAGAAKPAKSKK